MTDAWHTIIELSELEPADVTQVQHSQLTLAVYDTRMPARICAMAILMADTLSVRYIRVCSMLVQARQ